MKTFIKKILNMWCSGEETTTSQTTQASVGQGKQPEYRTRYRQGEFDRHISSYTLDDEIVEWEFDHNHTCPQTGYISTVVKKAITHEDSDIVVVRTFSPPLILRDFHFNHAGYGNYSMAPHLQYASNEAVKYNIKNFKKIQTNSTVHTFKYVDSYQELLSEPAIKQLFKEDV